MWIATPSLSRTYLRAALCALLIAGAERRPLDLLRSARDALLPPLTWTCVVFAARRSSALGRSPASSAAFQGRCAVSCSAARGSADAYALDSWALLRLLCDYSCALRCLLLYRCGSLPSSVLRLAWLPCCLLHCCSWGSAVAYAWTRGAPPPLV